MNLHGRANILDAYPWPSSGKEGDPPESLGQANSTETRWQVGIDRKTGQAHGGTLFDLETVIKGRFYSEIHIKNFQLWQLGLVAAVVRDIDDGFVAIGFGKSRGLGRVRMALTSLRLETVDRKANRLAGMAALGSAEERSSYGLFAVDTVALPLESSTERTWRGTRLSLTESSLGELLAAVVEGPLVSYLQDRVNHGAAGGRP